MFLGGAGMGKSFLINLISKWTERILRKEGDAPNKPVILLLGPTGMSACIIGNNQR